MVVPLLGKTLEVEDSPGMVCYARPNLFNPAQRYIYICKPYLTKHWCTVKKTVMGVSLAMLLSIAHVVTRTVDRTYTVWTSGERNYSFGDNKMCLY